MRYYLIAGEASGDLHASHLMQAVQQNDAHAEFRYIGGDQMASVGGMLVRHYRTLAYMGFFPVLCHLPTILKALKDCKADIQKWKPDVIILVDYPGFNLKIADFISKQYNAPFIFYYIPPKIWAWKEWRIKTINRTVDWVGAILPFEIDYYKQRHTFHRITYIGNPTLDEVRTYEQKHPRNFTEFIEENNLNHRPVIALLAGSRQQEIHNNLAIMLRATQHLIDRYQIVVAGAPGIDETYYSRWIRDFSARVIYGQTYRLLQHAEAALVTSGTATLETALFRVPQVVCYHISMGKIVNLLRRIVLKIPYISLVNLIADYKVVTELVGNEMTEHNIRYELESILSDGDRRTAVLKGYEEVARRLGPTGASHKAAKILLDKSQHYKIN